MTQTAADLVAASFQRHGIRDLWVYPGGTIAPILDAVTRLGASTIRCTRHEQGAGYGALAQARILGRPQVAMVTSGPGATNLVTPICDAWFDSLPLVAICGQVGVGSLRGDLPVRQRGFQECDMVAMLRPVTKAQFRPLRPGDLVECIEQAFALAAAGRPGPVLIDCPIDIQRQTVEGGLPEAVADAPRPSPDPAQIAQVLAWLAAAERPLAIAGQGVLRSGAQQHLRRLSAHLGMAVSHSLLGLGALPSDDALALGFHGHTGSQAAGLAIQEADALLVLGSRLDVRQTGNRYADFAKQARIIKVETDPGELSASPIRSDLTVQADVGDVLAALAGQACATPAPRREPWRKRIAALRRERSPAWSDAGPLKPQAVISALDAATAGREVLCISGVGSHQQWTARHITFDHPRRMWLTSGGHGAMGFDLPSAIGAALTRPQAVTLCLVGDGSFQMNIQELAAATEFGAAVRIVVLDNHRLGIVSQFQKLNWGDDPTCGRKTNPDFAAIATAYGLAAWRVTDRESLARHLPAFLGHAGPSLLHCIVDEDEDVSPMLLPNQTLDAMWSRP